MTEWYYARGGQQSGPVSFERLVEIARGGGLNPTNDLVWSQDHERLDARRPGAGDFRPGCPAFRAAAGSRQPLRNSRQHVDRSRTNHAGRGLEEIIPGSEPLDIGGCLTRGFELTKRQFGVIVLVGLTYFGMSLVAGLVFGLIDSALGLGQTSGTVWKSAGGSATASYQQSGGPVNAIGSQLLSIFLSLGGHPHRTESGVRQGGIRRHVVWRGAQVAAGGPRVDAVRCGGCRSDSCC